MISSLEYLSASFDASTASRTLRAYVTPSRLSMALRAYCWVIVEAPWRLAAGDVVPRGAGDADVVDAVVLVELAVLGRGDRVLYVARESG